MFFFFFLLYIQRNEFHVYFFTITTFIIKKACRAARNIWDMSYGGEKLHTFY